MTGAVKPEDLQIGIAAHVSRLDKAKALQRRVKAQVLNVDYTEATCYEEAVTACAANHLTVLRELVKTTPHDGWIVVLEDDALPVRAFRKHAAAALAHAPEKMVGFYFGKVAAHENSESARNYARREGYAWFRVWHMLSAVAYAIHGSILQGIINCYPGYEPTDSVERRLTNWALAVRGGFTHGSPCFCYTVPSLVDHSVDPSIVFPDAKVHERTAWWVGVAKNWDTPAIEYECRYE